MKHFFLIVLTTLFANYAYAQGVTRNGEITNNGSEYVNKNGTIGSTDGVNKNGEIVLAVAPITTVTSSTGRVWMDRNLGATQVATSSTDEASYGDLYQWGRANDGHQIINWTSATAGTPANGTTATTSTTDSPGNALFITTSASPYDWRSGQNANLWQGLGVNNPCPTGFRIPTEAELNAERALFSPMNAEGAYASVLKLPMPGWRRYSIGSLAGVGTEGNYWSSTVSGTQTRYLLIHSSNALMSNAGRADGLSVRCIKN